MAHEEKWRLEGALRMMLRVVTGARTMSSQGQDSKGFRGGGRGGEQCQLEIP